MTATTPPGWYPGEGDPPGTVRWWDGQKWANEYVVQDTQSTAAPDAMAGGAMAGGAMAGGAMGGASPVYASWGQRVGATLLDAVIAFAMIIPVFILGAIVGAISSVLGALVVFVGYIAALVAIYYLLYWGQGTTGQSPGKRLMGIETIDHTTGQYIGGGIGLARGILAFINTVPFLLGVLWPLWDDKSQTFTDKIFNSVVVQTNRPKDLMPLFPNGKPF